METPQPPPDFVLRPHHIALCAIFVLAYKDFEFKGFPPPFQLRLYRLLLDEVSEVTKPRSAASLQNLLTGWPEIDNQEAQRMISSFCSFKLESADQLVNFFAGVPPLFIEKSDEDEPSIFTPRSIFGYFCRRCFVGFLKLSVPGVIKLREDFALWWRGKPNEGYDPIARDKLNHSGQQIFKTIDDAEHWASADSYEQWLKSLATGDETISVESIRNFFEQHFHDGNDSGLRQHGLLNLCRMHFIRAEFSAARKLLLEAINVSRTSGDKLTLQQCMSLLHRFPPEEGQEERRPPLNEVQPHLHPLEILYDVKKLMDEKHEQPLTASFSKIVQAIGVYDYWFEHRFSTLRDTDQWAQHAVQAVVWNAAGCEELGSIECDTVIAFTPKGGDDNNRLTCILNQAYRRARQGFYENALAMLLEPCVWKGLAISDYGLWAQEVWHILALRASRRGQHRLSREYILPRRPPGDFNPRHYLHKVPSSTNNKIADPLYEVIQMKECDHASVAIEPLLTALWHAEFLFRIHYYRTGMILLADVGLEFGLSRQCKRMVENIMPQVITGKDVEQRALAAFTLARCTLACDDRTANSLQDVVYWLAMAEKDYLTLEMYRSATDVQYLLSVVYHNLGMETERDGAAQRHIETEKKQKQAEDAPMDDIVAILDVVSSVGVALSLSR
ncbi:hypothetical protein E1B28_000880 [Marasmius oreades]|uniref:Anaphase-promoting complex subunit 5 n=1 Tax=Marasmius oreades TaxID=181124 RepID=A0A9P7V295_9AGAR|nr:uncharacterized protein E1B28_000880 [Marasmius oreades]KAG7098994.1 hypothetical protein E1B28_000880 [Marasmius oreades]